MTSSSNSWSIRTQKKEINILNMHLEKMIFTKKWKHKASREAQYCLRGSGPNASTHWDLQQMFSLPLSENWHEKLENSMHRIGRSIQGNHPGRAANIYVPVWIAPKSYPGHGFLHSPPSNFTSKDGSKFIDHSPCIYMMYEIRQKFESLTRYKHIVKT